MVSADVQTDRREGEFGRWYDISVATARHLASGISDRTAVGFLLECCYKSKPHDQAANPGKSRAQCTTASISRIHVQQIQCPMQLYFYLLDHIQTPSNCPITEKETDTFTIMGTPYTFCNGSADIDGLQFRALLFVCPLRNGVRHL